MKLLTHGQPARAASRRGAGDCAILGVAIMLVAGSAWAERGLFVLSLSSGQAASVAPLPGAGRGVPIISTLEYGFSERWSGALTTGIELTGAAPTPATQSVAPTLVLSLGPRATLLRTDWWTIDGVLAPELLWVVPRQLDVALRLGVSVRYQLLWGVGIGIEVSVRGRASALGPFAPWLQGLVIAGLFIEA